jgi:hypothetical protein
MTISRNIHSKHILGPLENRFWPKVKKSDSCWEWTAAKTVGGYGVIYKNGSNYSAHRASYEINIGPIPDGLFVLHRCDNRSCVRPDHLFLGTSQDNVDDMHAKGRRGVRAMPKGVEHARAKLTEAAVLDIRSGRLSLAEFSRLYGVGETTASLARDGMTWRHVPMPHNRAEACAKFTALKK